MKVNEILAEAKSAHPKQAATAIAMKKAGKKPKNESTELEEEFDLIESIIERLAEHNGVDAEVIWEDLETLTEDELYAFAVTSEPIMESQGVAEDQVNEAQTYGRDNPYEVKPGENFSKVFEPGRKSGVHYHLMTGSVADPFYFKLNNKLYSVSQNGDGIPREVGVDDNDLGNDVPMPSLIDYGKSSAQDPNLQLAKDYAKLYGHYDPEDMDDINSLLYVMRSNPRVKADFERAVEWARSKNKGVTEDWQKANKRDRTDGMSQKAVNAYRRENPGSKLKTAVTTKPSKLKKGGKASKRRKSYCSRSRGQMKMHSISCSKTPDKAICKARRRWNC